MPKIFTSKNQRIGKASENIAVRFLMKHGFKVLERNYTRPWGEIDIVARKSGKLFFIEVKSISVSWETMDRAGKRHNHYRPEDNMHPLKMRRMARTIQTYFLERNISEETEWQVDLLVIYVDLKLKKAQIKVVKDIIL